MEQSTEPTVQPSSPSQGPQPPPKKRKRTSASSTCSKQAMSQPASQSSPTTFRPIVPAPVQQQQQQQQRGPGSPKVPFPPNALISPTQSPQFLNNSGGSQAPPATPISLPHVETMHVPPISAATPPLSPQSAIVSPMHTPVQTHHQPGANPQQPHQLPSYQLPPPIVQYQQALPSISGVLHHQTAIHPHAVSAAGYPAGSPNLYPTPYLTTSPVPQPVRYERILPKHESAAAAAATATAASPALTPSNSGQITSTTMPPPPAPNPLTPSVTFTATSPYQHPTYAAQPPPHYTLIPQASPHLQPTIHSPPTLMRASGSSEPKTSTADQRELLRKVSHSAIERRRRERINDKILQLKQLVPSCADQDQLHKLSILQSAIEYIRYLQGITEGKQSQGGVKKEPSSSFTSATTPTPNPALTSYTSQFTIKPEQASIATSSPSTATSSPPPPLSIPSPALHPYGMPPPPAPPQHNLPASSPSSPESASSSAAASPALPPSTSDHEEATGGLLMLSAAVSAREGLYSNQSSPPASKAAGQPENTWTVTTTALRPKDVVAAGERSSTPTSKEVVMAEAAAELGAGPERQPGEMSVGNLLCS
ncbi:hypothetical protein BC938DRAFT_477195 [Jimgerdemannia flammicorona]|uniref:BHLH domain-containing protein n=1 Tax=Jimgerdemannia flammicorona TaxID=994334 RepID=A0A433PBC3_9FUNG|nr:hypothetical protein BC938DRAFT_477195 [Jimgerdemannia flammicorona]